MISSRVRWTGLAATTVVSIWVMPAMAATADLATVTGPLVEWVRTTAQSTPFVIGALIGVLVGEGSRVAWRGLARALLAVLVSYKFVKRYAILAIIAIAAYSAVLYWLFG